MASINYAHKEIVSKIVYYGPGVSGKTTNLQHVFKKIPSDTRGELISLATDADRTLYFDFLPVNVGSIQGFTTKFQLYTVPGQVYYNATRKLVLRGVDGVVFVADSQNEKMDENIESLQNLRDNLIEYGYEPDEIPTIIQYNKRDLPNAAPIEEMQKILNANGLPHYEAIATTGEGVFKTLKAISKLVLEEIRTKTMGGSPSKPKSKPKPEPVAVGSGESAGGASISDDVKIEPQATPSPQPTVEPPKPVMAPAAQSQVEIEESNISIEPDNHQTPVGIAEPEPQTQEPVIDEPQVQDQTAESHVEPETEPEISKADDDAELPQQDDQSDMLKDVVKAFESEMSVKSTESVVDVSEATQSQQQTPTFESDTPSQATPQTPSSESEPEKPRNVKPGIMEDDETFANVVVSDSQGLPNNEEEESVKDDLEETTERSVLSEGHLNNVENAETSLDSHDEEIPPVPGQLDELVDNASEEISETIDSKVESISEFVDSQSETEEVSKPSLDNFDEESIQDSDLSFNSPLSLGKPQMAESRKVKNKRRFNLFGLFKKSKS